MGWAPAHVASGAGVTAAEAADESADDTDDENVDEVADVTTGDTADDTADETAETSDAPLKEDETISELTDEEAELSLISCSSVITGTVDTAVTDSVALALVGALSPTLI